MFCDIIGCYGHAMFRSSSRIQRRQQNDKNIKSANGIEKIYELIGLHDRNIFNCSISGGLLSIWAIHIFNIKFSLVFIFVCLFAYEIEELSQHPSRRNSWSFASIHRYICPNRPSFWCSHHDIGQLYFFMAISSFLWNFIWK